jgi:hypothetical protein
MSLAGCSRIGNTWFCQRVKDWLSVVRNLNGYQPTLPPCYRTRTERERTTSTDGASVEVRTD